MKQEIKGFIIKKIKMETIAFGNVTLVGLLILVGAIFSPFFVLKAFVHPALLYPLSVFLGVLVLILNMKSKYNPTKRLYQTIYYKYMKPNGVVYTTPYYKKIKEVKEL